MLVVIAVGNQPRAPLGGSFTTRGFGIIVSSVGGSVMCVMVLMMGDQPRAPLGGFSAARFIDLIVSIAGRLGYFCLQTLPSLCCTKQGLFIL